MTNREAVAYHEAGHAVISMKLGYPCLYVTIIPDGDRLGHVCCEGQGAHDGGWTAIDTRESRMFACGHKADELPGSS